jgi:UDP-2,3-diacylglucosamine hydrolase
MGKPVYFVSDVHAGIRHDSTDEAKLEDFRRLLAEAAAQGGELVLLGDLFDFWFEWREVVPKRHFLWLEALRDAVRGGLHLSLLPGNHDFRLQGFLDSTIGLHLPGDFERRRLGGRRVLLHHGDGLDRSERGYRLLRAVLRSRLTQTLFRWLHPDLGMRLADRMGAGDRDRTWSASELGGYFERALPGLIEPGDELAVFGHVHLAARTRWGACEIRTLPPFVHASRGYGLLEDGELRAAWLRPQLAPPVLELQLAGRPAGVETPA